jgi:hypothetical protein
MYTNDVLALQGIAEPHCLAGHKPQPTLTRIPWSTIQASRYPSYAVHVLAQNGDTVDSPKFSKRIVKGTLIRNKSVFVLSIYYRQEQNHMLGLWGV